MSEFFRPKRRKKKLPMTGGKLVGGAFTRFTESSLTINTSSTSAMVSGRISISTAAEVTPVSRSMDRRPETKSSPALANRSSLLVTDTDPVVISYSTRILPANLKKKQLNYRKL